MNPSPSPRIGRIDTARFLAIALVFSGHRVEQVMYLDSAAAAAQYKWVYRFHMPLSMCSRGSSTTSAG